MGKRGGVGEAFVVMAATLDPWLESALLGANDSRLDVGVNQRRDYKERFWGCGEGESEVFNGRVEKEIGRWNWWESKIGVLGGKFWVKHWMNLSSWPEELDDDIGFWSVIRETEQQRMILPIFGFISYFWLKWFVC